MKNILCGISIIIVITMIIFNVNITMKDVSEGVSIGLANLEALADEEGGKKRDDDKGKNGPATPYEVTCTSGGRTSTTTSTVTTVKNNGIWSTNANLTGNGAGFLGGSLGGGYNSGGGSTTTTTTESTTTTSPSSTSKQIGYNCPKQTSADCTPFSPC